MSEVPQEKHRLKPSSSARLERWALALRLAQIERGTKPVLDDDDLKSYVWRRMEGEYRRDGEPSSVVDAMRSALGCESVEYLIACREARRLSEGVRAWSELFRRDWERSYVPLSAAVHWIATKGRPYLCAVCRDSDLENAASRLLTAANDEKIIVFGVRDDDENEEPVAVPHRYFIAESAFAGDVPDCILFSDVPVVRWILDMEEDWRIGNGDTIETRSKILWRRLCVKREDMLQWWPAAQGEDVAESAGSTNAREDQMLLYKTGAQGRPSAIQLVEREAERRRASGEAVDNLTTEAKSLHDWCKREHPNAPTPTSKTIENRIRCAHRNWKATK